MWAALADCHAQLDHHPVSHTNMKTAPSAKLHLPLPSSLAPHNAVSMESTWATVIQHCRGRGRISVSHILPRIVVPLRATILVHLWVVCGGSHLQHSLRMLRIQQESNSQMPIMHFGRVTGQRPLRAHKASGQTLRENLVQKMATEKR